jgi:cytochrome c biogenesis protein CcmG, thiol:disulfide interchange protein DsbE
MNDETRSATPPHMDGMGELASDSDAFRSDVAPNDLKDKASQKEPPVARPARRPVAPYLALGLAVLIAGFVFVLARAPKGDGPESAATPLLNAAAPNLGGTTLDGGSFNLASRRGSWVVVNFFSTTCIPCRDEHPALVEFHNAQAAKPQEARAELVSSVFFDSETNVRKFFTEQGGGNWPIVLDTNNANALAYSVAKVPETWIIDPNGVVRKHVIEALSAERLELLLTQLRA